MTQHTTPLDIRQPEVIPDPSLRDGLLLVKFPAFAQPQVRCTRCECTVARSHVPGGVRCVEGAQDKTDSIREW